MYHKDDINAVLVVIRAEIDTECMSERPSLRRLRQLEKELEDWSKEQELAFPY
jgi:hypothetical protein